MIKRLFELWEKWGGVGKRGGSDYAKERVETGKIRERERKEVEEVGKRPASLSHNPLNELEHSRSLLLSIQKPWQTSQTSVIAFARPSGRLRADAPPS